jgi:hypothetical protein
MSSGNVSPSGGFSSSWNGPALGSAVPISSSAAALEDYTSPNEAGMAVNQLEEEEVNLSQVRGTVNPDEAVHKLVSWTMRKDYQTFIGISLPIKNWVGGDYHSIQFWEEASEPVAPLEHPTADIYAWLVSRLRGRANSLFLPVGMPAIFEDLSVTTSRSGEAGYILYEPDDSFAGKITEMPVRVRLSHHFGYTKIGMGDRCTLQMLAAEFWTLTHNGWNLSQLPSSERDPDGTIVHGTTEDQQMFHQALPIDEMDEPPVRIQEDNARGTSINFAIDQAHMLQYWAWSGQAVRVGIGLNINDYSCGYWLDIIMQQVPDEEEGRVHFEILHQHWLTAISHFSPQIANACQSLGSDFGYKMKYQNNVLKV